MNAESAPSLLGKHAPSKSSAKVPDEQAITITGTVLDDQDDPIPGATVMIQGSTKGVITDIDGVFEIKAQPNDKLVISFLGMQTQTVPIQNRSNIVVKLLTKGSELDEVTVVAFGKQRKASVIGAISTVSMEDIKMPVGRLSNSLAGQLAGIVSMTRSGEPGTSSEFYIRGVNTFGSNSTPLVLVDGIERALDSVDFEDIASLSILKDATATALYGVRGANGIVLITTRRGTESKPKVSARVEYGVTAPVRMPKLANASQWIDFYNDVNLDASGRLAITPEEKAKYLNGTDPDLYPNVDWLSTLFKDMAQTTSARVNVTGGTQTVRYYVGASVYSEGSILNIADNDRYDANMSYKKYTFRSNIDINVTSSTELSLSLYTQYGVKNQPNTSLSDLYAYAIRMTPIGIPAIFSDGTLSAVSVNGLNPYNRINHTGYSESFSNNAQSLISLTQDLSRFVTPGLKANAKFSWDVLNAHTLVRSLSPTVYYSNGRDSDGNLIYQAVNDGSDYMSLSRSNSGTRTMNVEASLTYDRIFDDRHHVGAMFLFNMREYTNHFPASYVYAFPYRNMGIAGRATYSFYDRYFAEFNFGYNGSENFAPGKKYGFFPSYAIGYMISNEKFWEPLIPVVNLLKFKASTGEIGNGEIGGNRRFAFNSEMLTGQAGYYFGTSPAMTYGIAVGVPGNDNVTWERARKTNIGMELGLFNKLKLSVDYFYEKRSGIFILQESVPSVVGQNVAMYVNLGEMQNKGIDASLEYSQHFGEVFLSGRANFSFNRNRKLYDDKATPIWPYQSEAGFAYQQQRGLIALGLFESEEDIANSPTQTFGTVRPGDIKYKDINGDGVIDAYDKVAIGYTTIPEINYGFGLSGSWKGFDAQVFFQGVSHVTRIIGGDALYGASDNFIYMGQIFEDVALNRWTVDNPDPNAKYPRLSMIKSDNNLQASTYWQRDMSFLRLKSAEVGYTLPKKWYNSAGVSSIRFYLQGINLLTFSPFKLWDPELDASYGNIYPQMKTMVLGLNVNF